jgi:hypothetical protein
LLDCRSLSTALVRPGCHPQNVPSITKVPLELQRCYTCRSVGCGYHIKRSLLSTTVSITWDHLSLPLVCSDLEFDVTISKATNTASV